MKAKANEHFDDAVEKLNEASSELFKPEEDVVSYAVCKNAQTAIENYLKGYLFTNGIDPSNYKTIQGLYKQCLEINGKFSKIDLSEFNCKSREIDSSYCNEVSTVSRCFDIADTLDSFLRQEKVIN